MSTGGAIELDPAQQAGVAAIGKRQHVLVNCGPGMGKTSMMQAVAAMCAKLRWAFLGCASSDRAKNNLEQRGLDSANMARVLTELKRVADGKGPSAVAQAHAGLESYIRAVRGGRVAVLGIDECGLISAETFDLLVNRLRIINPRGFEARQFVLFLAGDFANQLPPVEGMPFIYSHVFSELRSNTFLPRLTKQHRFTAPGAMMEVSHLLSAGNDELQQYLRAQSRAYQHTAPLTLATTPTFVPSRAECERHFANAVPIAFPTATGRSFRIEPSALVTRESSATTAASYVLFDGLVTSVEITTMGGPLEGKTEDGTSILIPNRAICTLFDLFDTPGSSAADKLAGKATAAVGYCPAGEAEESVVMVPLIHRRNGIDCVTLRMAACGNDDVGSVACTVLFNTQGYEIPGVLAVGAYGSEVQPALARVAIIMVATRTPDGITSVLFHPRIQLRKGNGAEDVAYRKQLSWFTASSTGSGRSEAAERRAKRPLPARGASATPRETAKRRHTDPTDDGLQSALDCMF